MRTPNPEPTFRALLTTLLNYPAPILPPSHPLKPTLTAQISSLQLHPTLEAALHILNQDLPSAHFLVRHMQSPPAYEGMFLHGILHRVEGDYDNARMWYHDCKDGEVFQVVWGKDGKGFKDVMEEREEFGKGGKREGEMDGGQRFLNGVQAFGRGGKKVRSAEEEAELEKESRREIEAVVNFCVRKFGEGRWEDASSAWVKNSEEIQDLSDKQINGNEGHRKF